jgi:molybdate transport system ATP-binding protein
VNGRGDNHAGTEFHPDAGDHCLTLNETLPASGITAIFGVSGAGKTSLINAISGLTQPQSGRIVLNGRVLNDVENGICLTPEKRRVGYVFQDARLFPHYGARQPALRNGEKHGRTV